MIIASLILWPINLINAKAVDNITCENNKFYINGIERLLMGVNYESMIESADLCMYIENIDVSFLDYNEKGIILVNDGENLNKEMLRDGLFKTTKTNNITFNKMFCTAEKEARDEMRGIWKTGFTQTECEEADYAEEKESLNVTEENTELREQLNIKDPFTIDDLLRYVLVFVVAGGIIFIKFKKIKNKKRH